MEHVVFSAAVDGVGEEFRRVSSLEEAVRVVEHLRNDLGIEQSLVFALTPVPLAFRTYYRVEVPGVEFSPLALVSEPEPAADPAPAPGDETPVAEAVEAFERAEPSQAPEPAELPAMFAPGLEPRGELGEHADAESEHSLGYFTR